MDPFLLLRWPLLWIRFWQRKMGGKRFWTLFGISTLVVVVLVVLKV